MAQAIHGTGRLAYLETARGLACLLLVAFHVVGDSPENGLQLPSDHALPQFNAIFANLRMPLFSFISGIVFSAAVKSLSDVPTKTLKKARRLLLPLVVVGTLHFMMQHAFADGSSKQLWQIYILPYEHFWFLQSTFLLMVATLVIGALTPGRNLARHAVWLAALAAVVYVYSERWHPDYFSGWKAFYLAPYFFMGLWLQETAQRQWKLRPDVRGFAMTAAVTALPVASLIAQAEMFSLPGSEKAWSVAISISFCLALLLLRIRWKPLSLIGEYSYAIFLFHVFFTAGTRILLEKALPGLDAASHFAAGLGAGIIGPIAMHWLIMRTPAASLPLLGVVKRQSPTRTPPPGATSSDAAHLQTRQT